MGLLPAAIGVALAILAGALLVRRPLVAAGTAGLLLGPAFYVWLGGHLARLHGEGRFYSFPFGGYRLGGSGILSSLAVWMAGAGALAYVAARALRRRG